MTYPEQVVSAQAEWHARVTDRDRPLAPRGTRETGLAGDRLRADTVAATRQPLVTPIRVGPIMAAIRSKSWS